MRHWPGREGHFGTAGDLLWDVQGRNQRQKKGRNEVLYGVTRVGK